MPEFPQRLSIGEPDQQVTYELAEDQLLIRVADLAEETELSSFLSEEGLESREPPEHVRRASATLRPAGLRWITLRQRFASMASADNLLEERSDIAEVRPVYYETGGGPETAATPMFDTLIVRIADDMASSTIPAITSQGCQHNEPMSSLLAPYHVFIIPADDGAVTAERGQSIARGVAALEHVVSVEFDWLKLETYMLVPTDTFWPNQWDMVQMSLGNAWDVQQGDPNVWIAVIDSGFDLGHPDLSFTPNAGGTLTHFNADEFIGGAAPPYDAGSAGVFHGTACAGLAAATLNNGAGVAGVAGGCTIMPVRVGGIPTAARVTAALNWATANGARVASLSLTTTQTAAATAALSNAWAAGMVLCAATGNSGDNTTSPAVGFPARHANVVAVGASDQADQRKRPASADGECWGSQFDANTDVIAPGVRCWTTDEQGAAGYNSNAGGPVRGPCVNNASGGDASGDYLSVFNGTSAATPHVAGLAALVISQNPALTNQQVRDIIESTCDKVNPGIYPYATVAGRPNGTWHQEVGYGRVNAFQAVSAASAGNPAITSPVPDSVLSGPSVNFSWSANGAAVSEWWLWVGSSLGGSDLLNSGSLGTSLSTTVSGLPTNGTKVFVRLWFKIGGAWQSADFQYTAAAQPTITSPAPDSVLSGPTVAFNWSANGAPVAEWWLWVGSSLGGADLLNSGSLGTSLLTSVSGLPTNGTQIFVRLWFKVGVSWQSADFQYTAAAQPAIASPVPDSALSGPSVSFSWSANGAAVSEWWLWVGSSLGGSDLLNSGSLGTNLSTTVSGLPTNGTKVFVRLWFKIGGAWQSADFQYTAAAQPTITSPAPDSVLSGPTVAFNWSANGAPVAEWWLWVGSSLGGADLLNSGSLGTSLSTTVSGLPTNGTKVFVRLWFKIGGAWQSADFQYTAASQPTITSPVPDSVLSGPSVSFSWSANGVAVSEWWLWVGSSPGGADLLNSGSLGTSLSTTVSGLPTNGTKVFVRLWFKIGGGWQFADFQYTAAPDF